MTQGITVKSLIRRAFPILILAVAACTPLVDVMDVDKIQPGEREAAASVRIVPIGSPQTVTGKFMGSVEANSCKFLLWDKPPSQTNATIQLQIKALRLGADTVSNYACNRSGTDAYGTNCWGSVTCGGDAFKTHS